MGIRIRKEVEVIQDVDIEIDLDDFDDEELIEEIIQRGIDLEEIDKRADSWEFTKKMYDYFKKEIDKLGCELDVVK